MKMFKRFAAAFLAGVMALAMLTACGRWRWWKQLE